MRGRYLLGGVIVALVVVSGNALAQISLTGTTYTQDFDSMGSAGSSATTPTGWFIGGVPATNGAVGGTIVVNDTGTGTVGTNFNFGVAGTEPVTNRALGSLASNNGSNRVTEVRFTNNTGSTISNLFISYDGQQWRDGGSGNINDLSLHFSADGISFTGMTAALTFKSPKNTLGAGALDGHALENREVIGGNFSTNIANGATFYLRWLDPNDLTSDSALAVDNFSVTVDLPGTTIMPNTTNMWSNTFGGKWEDSSSWSAGLPVPTQPAHLITGGISKTVLIDATTASAPYRMAVSNLTISTTAISFQNILSLDNAGTTTRFRVLGTLTLNLGGNIAVNNSAIRVAGPAFRIGDTSGPATLTITNAGVVIATESVLGNSTASSNNSALVTGTGSVWDNSGSLNVGAASARNTLTITGGGVVFDEFGRMGNSNNTVIVNGTGSVWSNRSSITVAGFANQLIITNGGAVFNAQADLGFTSSNNTARVVDNGMWFNSQTLFVGFQGWNTTLIIAGGKVVARDAVIGSSLGTPSNNVIRVDSGSLIVTNTLGGAGQLTVSPPGTSSRTGSLIINGGSVTADSLVASNGLNSIITFNGGVMFLRGAHVANGADFKVGGELNNATLTFVTGTNRFGNGFWVSPVTSATGAVWMLDGQLVTTNSDSFVGRAGHGRMTVSNGTWRANRVTVGFGPVSIGTLTVAGGVNEFSGAFLVGSEQDSQGTVWITGGQLVFTNAPTVIGSNGFGRATLSNGTWLANHVFLGFDPFFGATGIVSVAGGNWFVTNAAGNATLNIRSGTFTVNGGTAMIDRLVATNTTGIAEFSSGTMTLSGADVANGQPFSVGGPGQTAVLKLPGGTNRFVNEFMVGPVANSTGIVWMADGLLTNNVALVGSNGIGQVTISNGIWRTGPVIVGRNAGSRGTVTIAGGTNIVSSSYDIGLLSGATGEVWVTGGRLVTTNFGVNVGSSGVGRLSVSNGSWFARLVNVGQSVGSMGTLTIAGGVSTVYSNMTVGICGSATGIVNVTSGSLYITNSSITAVLDVRGTVNQSGGLISVNQLIITNACGRYFISGSSTLITILPPILTPEFDADGDGVPNGADPGPLDQTNANDDPDGDGFTNFEEYLAGTDPLDNASSLRITGIAVESTDIRVTWSTAAGKTNALERTAGVFTNPVTIFTATNTTAGTTNFLDTGAANVSNWFYRVRLVP